MRLILTLFISVLCGATAYVQQTEAVAIKQTITALFDGMRKADTAMVRSAFGKGMIMHSISTNAAGSNIVINEKPDDFIKLIGATIKMHMMSVWV